jgi:hypothetical protein
MFSGQRTHDMTSSVLGSKTQPHMLQNRCGFHKLGDNRNLFSHSVGCGRAVPHLQDLRESPSCLFSLLGDPGFCHLQQLHRSNLCLCLHMASALSLRKTLVPGMVAHTCHPRYLGGRDREAGGSRPAWRKNYRDPISISKVWWHEPVKPSEDAEVGTQLVRSPSPHSKPIALSAVFTPPCWDACLVLTFTPRCQDPLPRGFLRGPEDTVSHHPPPG